jgi:hypothetical protein
MRLLFPISFGIAGAAAAIAAFAPACGGSSAAEPPPPPPGDAATFDGAAVVDGAPLQDAAAPKPTLACAAPYDMTSNDPHNCGAPGRDCLGSTCESGICAPQVLLTPDQYGFAPDAGLLPDAPVAIDDQNLYFVVGTSVYGIPKAGGTVFTVATAPAASSVLAPSLLLDGGTLYWAFATPDGAGGGIESVYSAPTSARGSPGTAIASIPIQGEHLNSPNISIGDRIIGALGQTLYLADPCLDVVSLPTAGGSALAPVYTPCVPDPFIDGGPLVPALTSGTPPIFFDRAGASMFVSLGIWSAAGGVEHVQLPSGAAQPLPTLPSPPAAAFPAPLPDGGPEIVVSWLGVANGTVYAAALGASGRLFFSMPADGSGEWTFVASSACSPVSDRFAVDGSHVYMVDPADPNAPVQGFIVTHIARLDLQTGNAVQVYSQLSEVRDGNVHGYADIFAFDDQFFYMKTFFGIVRIAK